MADETYTRLNRLERDLATVTSEVKSLTLVVSDLAKGVKDLHVILAARSQTDWKTVFAGLAIVITIGGLAFAPIHLRLNDVKDMQKELRLEQKEYSKFIYCEKQQSN